MRARAELTVEPGPTGPCMRWSSAPPVVLRPTGPHRVHLVQAAGGPLGGDDLGLAVRLGRGVAVQVCSAAATVVQPGSGAEPARWTVVTDVAEGSMLDWRPEPTIICDQTHLHSSITVTLRHGARALLREMMVLGRAGQRGGRFHGELTVESAGVPLLAHTMLLDGTDPVLAGPAGTGGARAIGALVVVGEGLGGAPRDAGEEPGLRWAYSVLDGPGWLLLALGDTPSAVARLLDQAALWSESQSPPSDEQLRPAFTATERDHTATEVFLEKNAEITETAGLDS
ncbi:MAG: urease accessory protein UreD [Pseudonocardiaceae bacterium]